MTTVEKILKLISERGITKKEFASAIGVTPSTISEWASNRQSPIQHIAKIADYFNVSVDYLLGREDKLPSNAMPLGRMIKMSVIGTISAGYDSDAVEEIIDEYPVLERAFLGYSPEECFVLRIKGDSMYPDFYDGDYVLIHKQSSVDSGSIAIILYNGDEATIKKVEYKQGEDWMRLVPRNPEYMPKIISGADLNECRVLGLVLSIVQRKIV